MNEWLPELDSAVEELAPMQHSREGGTLLKRLREYEVQMLPPVDDIGEQEGSQRE